MFDNTLRVILPFFSFFLLRGEFKNYVLRYPQGNPLITVIQVFAEILKHAGKWGPFAHAKTVLYGNESAM